MAQPVTAILSRQGELAEKARRFTGDVNEAGLLVGRVMSKAFEQFEREEREDVISAAMARELEVLIAARRAS